MAEWETQNCAKEKKSHSVRKNVPEFLEWERELLATWGRAFFSEREGIGFTCRERGKDSGKTAAWGTKKNLEVERGGQKGRAFRFVLTTGSSWGGGKRKSGNDLPRRGKGGSAMAPAHRSTEREPPSQGEKAAELVKHRHWAGL